MIAFWRNLISEDIAALDKEKSVVLLPISAIEQHGHHLPVGTDAMILEGLLQKFAAEKDFGDNHVLIAPQLFVGKSNEHMDFCGTMTFTAKTLYSVVEELVDSIAKSGFRKIILTNSHGGNTDLLNLISRDLRIKYKIQIYVVDWWFTSFWDDIMKIEKESESPYGVFHACELETSLIMALAPETVSVERIIDETPDEMFEGNHHITLFGPVNMGWRTKDVTKSGVIGIPSCASAEKGEAFLAYAVDRLTEIVEEVLNFQY